MNLFLVALTLLSHISRKFPEGNFREKKCALKSTLFVGISRSLDHFWSFLVKIGLLGEISDEISPSKVIFGIFGQNRPKMFNMDEIFVVFYTASVISAGFPAKNAP